MHKPLFVFSMLISTAAFAAVDEDSVRLTRHEFVLAPSTGNVTTNSLGTSFGASLGYHYSVSDAFQVGLVPSAQYASGGLWDVSLIGVMTYNFFADEGWRDSPFVSLAAGARYYRLADAGSTNAVYQATVGKRFELLRGVSYRPSLSVVRETGYTRTRLDFLAFSITF